MVLWLYIVIGAKSGAEIMVGYNIKEWTGHSLSSLLRIADEAEVDGKPSQQTCLSEYPRMPAECDVE